MKTTKLFLAVFVGFNCLAQSPTPQSAAPAPAFDAASVKLASEESMRTSGRRIQTSPGSLFTRGLSLRACIMWAYNMPAQIIGPDWLNDVRLDIVAKAATPVGDQQLYLMLRTLLTERLGVQAHVEKREMPVYALTLAKGGPKFSESATDGPMTVGQDKGALSIQHVSMSELAAEVSKGLDHPVIDATGLKGRYDIRIDMAAVTSANQTDRMDATNAIMTALQQQMGLKVENRKDLIDVLIIDHAEKMPTAN